VESTHELRSSRCSPKVQDACHESSGSAATGARRLSRTRCGAAARRRSCTPGADAAPGAILAEAQQGFVQNDTPIRLRGVGARIVGEVFAGLLAGDQHSYLNQDPTWKPLDQFTQDGKFGIAQLIAQAQQA
jgi:hypothetical protein